MTHLTAHAALSGQTPVLGPSVAEAPARGPEGLCSGSEGRFQAEGSPRSRMSRSQARRVAALQEQEQQQQNEHRCGICRASVSPSRFICEACELRLSDDLLAYTDRLGPAAGGVPLGLVQELETTATKQTRMTRPGGGGARSTERPLPFNDRASVILREDRSWLVDAAGQFGAPAPLVRGRSAAACALWLALHTEAIAAQPESVNLAREAARRSLRALHAVDRPPGTWYAGRCQECGFDLYAGEGAAAVACKGCGITYDVEEQRAKLLAAVEDRLATANEISRAVHLLEQPVTRSQIDHWVERGLLARRGRNNEGRNLYRIGDVLTLVARSAERQGGHRR